jgi:hypothetical protein
VATDKQKKLNADLKKIGKDYEESKGKSKTATSAATKKGNETVEKGKAKAKKLMKPKAKPAINIEEDAQAPAPSNDTILQITDLCKYAKNTQAKIDELNSQLAQQQGHLAKLLEVDIPEAMKVAGLKAFTLEDGSVVQCETKNYGSYTKENEPAVFAWMRKNGHGSLIKNIIAIQFGKGEDEKAEKLKALLVSKKFTNFIQNESIHAGSFKAFVREQLEAGNKLPKQIAIFPKTETTIKEPKNGNPSKKASSQASSQDRF